MAHAVAASVLKCPQLQLTDPEAKALAGAIKTVAAQHDIGSIVNPKVQAWLGLIGVAGAVYIPRAQFIKEAVKTRNAKDVTPEAEIYPPGMAMG